MTPMIDQQQKIDFFGQSSDDRRNYKATLADEAKWG
jgi:hypothetical protein